MRRCHGCRKQHWGRDSGGGGDDNDANSEQSSILKCLGRTPLENTRNVVLFTGDKKQTIVTMESNFLG